MQASPRPNGLTWARGTTTTARDSVSVSWKLDGQTINVANTVPAGAKAEFVKNTTHDELSVVVNGKKVE